VSSSRPALRCRCEVRTRRGIDSSAPITAVNSRAPVTAAQKRRFQALVPSLTKDMPSIQVVSEDDPGGHDAGHHPDHHPGHHVADPPGAHGRTRTGRRAASSWVLLGERTALGERTVIGEGTVIG
jgi:3'-phosphoadenosine 5'-phosphosulfate (PAPS) 3'-phosphatase